jgi:Fe-S cluster biogenesis protein NfuA/ferredoxin
MPRLTVVPFNRVLDAQGGETILSVCLKNDIPLKHNCEGTLACGTCHVIIKEGKENLSTPSDQELEKLDEVWGTTFASRLACQAKIIGDVSIEIPRASILEQPPEEKTFKEKVNEALQRVRPFLMMDGGDIELLDVKEQEGLVFVRLKGVCAFCPSAQFTLKAGIEKQLKQSVPEVKEVIALP